MSKAISKKAKPATKKVSKAVPAKKAFTQKAKQPTKKAAQKTALSKASLKTQGLASTKPKAGTVKKQAVKKIASKDVSPQKVPPKAASSKQSLLKQVASKQQTSPTTKKDTVSKSSSKSLTKPTPAKQDTTVKIAAYEVEINDLKEGLTVAPSVSSTDGSSNPTGQATPKGLMLRPVGKVARAVTPSVSTSLPKDTRKTVTDRALISQSLNQAPDILESDEGADPGFMQNDEVFDETDYAQHLQLMEQADVSRRARELNRPQTHPDFDGLHCVECEIEIPKLRLDAGRVRCVVCQEEIENESRRLRNLERGRG